MNFARWFLVLILAPFAAAQTTSGPSSLSGTVVDAQGRVIAGALISLSTDGVAAATTASTDASGKFQFAGIASGRYVLDASASGFQKYSKSLEIANGSDAEVQITLNIESVQSTVTVNGGFGSIAESNASTGSWTSMSLMDLPQSVQVVNRELLDEQKVYQFGDAVTYIAGVQRAYTTIAGAVGNEVSIRGFQLDYNNNYLRDGFKYPGTGLSDTADIESVEILKGPASAIYGTAEAGGIVNLTTKKPTSSPYVSMAMNGGSYDFYRPEIDASGPFNKRKTFLYRVNGVYENTGSFRDSITSVEHFVAPYFLWKPSESTSLALVGEVINVHRVSDYGTVLLGDRPAPVPVSTNYAEPWNNENDRDRQAGYRFNHAFDANWSINNGFQWSRSNARYLEVYTTGPATDPTQLTRLSDAFYFPAIYKYSQTTLSGFAKSGPITHHIALGFEAGWVSNSSEGPGGYAPDVSVLDPVIGTDFTYADAVNALQNPYFSLTYETVIHTDAGYAQDQIDLGRHWKAIAGLRAERYFQDSINQSNNTHQKQTDVPVSPRVGLVYQPADWASLYGSYVRSFIPTNPGAISSSGKQFSPEHDEQWEGGVKLSPSSGRMTATLALFQINKNNVLAPDPNNQVYSVQNGQERSKGVEFEFLGSPRPGWNLLASYAFIQAQVLKPFAPSTGETPPAKGSLLPDAPRNSGAIWATYQAPGGPVRNLGISAGVVATASREANYDNNALLPGYARLDLGAYYEFHAGEKQTAKLSINVQNALDRTYYLASNGTDQIRPGAPATILAGLQWTFR